MSVNVSCYVGEGRGAHWYLLTGPPPASTTAAMASLAPVSDSGYNCAALPVPVSNACLKALDAQWARASTRRLTVTAAILNSFRMQQFLHSYLVRPYVKMPHTLMK